MKLRQLRYLIAISEELNFTAAAARCSVSQPPLSRAIKDLEDEVGARLVERDTHRVSLTPAGALLVWNATRALSLLDDAALAARRLAEGMRGTIRMGLGGSTVYALMPSLIRRAKRSMPDVEIKFVAMPVGHQIEALRDGIIDIGLLRMPVHDELIETRSVYREPLIAVLPEDSALAGETGGIALRHLAAEKFVTYEPSRGFNYHIDLLALCRLAGFAPVIAHEAATTEAIVGIVACGEGVAIVPASAERLRVNGAAFRTLISPDGEPSPSVEFGLAWNRDRQSRLIEQFISVSELPRSGLGSDLTLESVPSSAA